MKPAILALVESLIATTALPATWHDYAYAKHRINLACAGDCRQYEMALKSYCEGVGL